MTSTLPEVRLNPFNDPATKPQWAQLTRLGGDRVAILFEELRRQIAKIDGIIESLSYLGPEEGWAAEYRADGTTLFTVRILPGVLEATMTFDASTFERFVSSGKLSVKMKDTLRNAEASGFIRLDVNHSSAVRSLANLAVIKSKL